MSEWKETTLGEISDVQTGPFGSQLHESDYVDEGTPMITVEHLLNNRISNIDTPKVSDEDKQRLIKYTLKEGDIVFSRVGSVDRCSYVSQKEDGWMFSGRLLRVRVDIKKADARFLSFYLMMEKTKQHIRNVAVGSTMPSLNTTLLEDVPVVLPPLLKQQSIAAILSSLDNKIDLLRRQNQTLEQLAQTIFKQWFVLFQYPGANGKMQQTELGEVPEGWRVYRLGDLLKTVSATHSFKNANDIIFLNTSDILEGQVLHSNYTDISLLPGQAKKSIKKDDILYSEIRPENKRFAYVDFDADDYVVSTKLMVLRAKAHVDPVVLYTYLTLPETIQILHQQAEARSGTFPQITFSQVEELLLTIPPDETLTKATNAIIPLFKKRKQNEKEIQTLTQLRDSLLPRLMSGKLSVG